MNKFVPGQKIMFYETPCIFLEEREEGLLVIAKKNKSKQFLETIIILRKAVWIIS